MGSKSVITLLVALFGVFAWSLLKETYFAIAIEEATERAAELLEIPGANMIAAATLLILTFGAGAIVAVTSYRLGARDRSLRPAFEFLYDEVAQNSFETLNKGPTISSGCIFCRPRPSMRQMFG
jgi:hypothetical protein